MNRKTINGVIGLGILAVLGILLVQIYWIGSTTSLHETSIAIQEREDSLNVVHLEEKINIALVHILEDIAEFKSDSSDLYGAIKQVEPFYYSVDIQEELHPFYLENLLKRELYSQHVNQDFQYGIYDCFNDSIVFGKLMEYSAENQEFHVSDTINDRTSEQLKWKKDGHYFTVFFPEIKKDTHNSIVAESYSPYVYLSLIVILVLLFFGFAVIVILKQKRLSEVKTDFINNMTHELKTPISTIGLSSEMILRADAKTETDKIKKYASLIFKENKRLENQVERVLNVAKLDKEAINLRKEAFDLHELFEEIKDNYELNSSDKKVTIELNLSNENCVVFADPVHITNVFYNLIDNATKYCKKNPEITITTNSTNKGVQAFIQDNGIGIKKENIRSIFDKFYRVPTGNLHDVKGFGLGLFYVKMILAEHNVPIKVTSRINEGTTFSLFFPVQ
ncbi:MAG TPA: HAMP domain-containing histidine kinase [Crocinitomicaceae bacterium]|nr:HAMP domain-containing histidine kinase [Crocinitomicaceae bacterium]